MRIGVPQETYPGECRVALDPASVKRLRQKNLDVLIERGAGSRAGFSDDEFVAAGAEIVESREGTFQADIVLQVRCLGANAPQGHRDLDLFRPGQWIVGFWDPLWAAQAVSAAARAGVTAVAVELVPRTTRAQSMDILSSMSTLAGYRAVILAAAELPRIFPLLMTAAGTLTPAKILVLGAGVAGLQAMATAKRLGAAVDGYDIRPAAREQVESVGARFVDLGLAAPQAEVAGGYAREMEQAFIAQQQAALATHIAAADVVITTALIPGRPSPILVVEDGIRRMRAGSVIVDLAAERGGNCPLSRCDESVRAHGVTILAPTNPCSDLPFHASQMLGRNLSELALLIHSSVASGKDLQDEILQAVVVTRSQQIVNEQARAVAECPQEPLAAPPHKPSGP